MFMIGWLIIECSHVRSRIAKLGHVSRQGFEGTSFGCPKFVVAELWDSVQVAWIPGHWAFLTPSWKCTCRVNPEVNICQSTMPRSVTVADVPMIGIPKKRSKKWNSKSKHAQISNADMFKFQIAQVCIKSVLATSPSFFCITVSQAWLVRCLVVLILTSPVVCSMWSH